MAAQGGLRFLLSWDKDLNGSGGRHSKVSGGYVSLRPVGRSRATAVQQGGQASATVSVASEQAATEMQVAHTSAVPSGQTGEAIGGRFSCILSCQILGLCYILILIGVSAGLQEFGVTIVAPGHAGMELPFLQRGHSGS